MESDSVKKRLAFIYGTLKRGHRNADLMTDPSNGSAMCVGKGRTVTKFPLVVATDYNLPFLLRVPDQGHEVQGEVYEVDDAMIQFLDKFEGHPDLYKRDDIAVYLTESKDGQPLTSLKEVQCSTYFLCEAKEDFLQLKFLTEFVAMAEDNLPYAIRNHRKIPLKTLIFPDRS